jgi:hypothetical protein
MNGKYLYCITKKLEPITFSTAGFDGAPIEIIHWDDFSCVVSDTDISEKEINRENAIAHEKVLEEVMQKSAIVPIAFGHVAKSEEEIKDKLLDSHKDKLTEALEYLDGKIELSIKAYWLDLAPIFVTIAGENDEIRKIKSKKKQSRDDLMRAGEIAAKMLEVRKESFSNEIISCFDEVTVDKRSCKLFGDQMIVNLAFLVEGQYLKTFDEKMNAFEETLADSNVKFKYTGPVPPYNFISLNLSLS